MASTRATITGNAGRRAACTLAMFALLAMSHAAAAALIDSIVVKFRGDEALADVQSLPDGHRFIVVAALRSGVTEIGRTKDGAFRLALEPPLPFVEAQAAINRLRLHAQILYVQSASHAERSERQQARVKGSKDDLPLHRIIVKYRDRTKSASSAPDPSPPQQRLDRIATLAGVAVGPERVMFDGSYVVRLFQRQPRQAVEQLAARLSQDPDVEYAEPDYRAFVNLAPNDPYYSLQWHYFEPVGGVNLAAAWNRTTGSPSIRVAVLDTGSLPHPDLVGRLVGGYDFVRDCALANDGSSACTFSPLPYNVNNPPTPALNSRDGDPSDPGDWVTFAESLPGSPPPAPYYDWFAFCPISDSSWHGTHVAGTIGAVTNNGVGVAAVNWQSPIVPVRVIGKCGGYSSDIAEAIVWASGGAVAGVPANAHPARVINLSLGGENPCSVTYQNAINSALSRNAVVVVAAGNSSSEASRDSPANCNGALTVAAIGRDGQRASYSNFDDQQSVSLPYPPNSVVVEVAAPGGSDGQWVLSTLNAGTQGPGAYNYAFYAGTSMATPHVAGIVSLMLSVNPALTPSQVLATIQATARPFPVFNPQNRYCTSNFSAVDTPPNFPKYCGAGIIDADAALAALGSSAASVALASSLNPSTSGQTVTFTATVAGNAPTGSVSFWANGIALGPCTAVPLSGAGNARTAQCSTSSLAAGTHSIGATYSGDANHGATGATPLAQTVNAPPPVAAAKQRDFDANARGDLLWRSMAGTAIWLMNGTTSMAAANIGAPSDFVATHTADFNGDGRTDILFRSSSSGETSIWLMNGLASAGTATLLSQPAWAVTHTGDFNGDGKADLIWYNQSTGTTALWLMNGLSATGAPTLLVHPSWRVTHVGDFNGDGTTDLVWTNEASGETAIWLMKNGAVTNAGVLLAHPGWRVTLIGDFNADARSDLVWKNGATGENAIWVMNGLGIVGNGIVLANPAWTPTHVGDLNGDGRSDLIWRNAGSGLTHAWLMNGLGILSSGSIGVPGASIVTTADFNGDGKADIVWHDAAVGDTMLRLMDGVAFTASTTVLRTTYWTVVP